MGSKADRNNAVRIAERAAEWLITLEDGSEAERAAFAEWIAASPQHLKEFLLMSALNGELRRVDPERRMKVEKLLAADGNVVGIETLTMKATPAVTTLNARRRGRWAAGVAAMTLVGALLYWAVLPQGKTYETAIGEQRRVELADGSVVQLNTGSRVQVSFNDTARDIRLEKGEALFKVAKDVRRPFRVRSGTSVVQALGTQFNVLQRPSGTVVSVIEGAVRVYEDGAKTVGAVRTASLAVGLAVGEEAQIDGRGVVSKHKAADLKSLAAWRVNRLVFRDDTLEDIAAEFNRYNKNVQIQLAADEIKSRRYTAVFDADDPNSLVSFIQELPGLAVERHENRVVVQAEGKR